ncbi:hypothetical protein ACFLU6_06815 [Acidobacteriota bacterium]
MDRMQALLIALALIFGAAAVAHGQQGYLNPDMLWDRCIGIEVTQNAQDPHQIDVAVNNRCPQRLSGELEYVAIVNGQRVAEGMIDLTAAAPYEFSFDLSPYGGPGSPLTIVFHGTFRVDLPAWGYELEIPILQVEEFGPEGTASP